MFGLCYREGELEDEGLKDNLLEAEKPVCLVVCILINVIFVFSSYQCLVVKKERNLRRDLLILTGKWLIPTHHSCIYLFEQGR